MVKLGNGCINVFIAQKWLISAEGCYWENVDNCWGWILELVIGYHGNVHCWFLVGQSQNVIFWFLGDLNPEAYIV